MFKNAAKKVFAAVLVCVLCVPCCFTSAQTEKYRSDFFTRVLKVYEVKNAMKTFKINFQINDVDLEPGQMPPAYLNRPLAKLYKINFEGVISN